MGNMSYCRFNNTSLDVNECLWALSDENEYDISNDEIRKGVRMFEAFLEFCEENGVIDGYNKDKIKRIFNDHNAETDKQDK